MMNFDSKKTEEYFYRKTRDSGLVHVFCDDDTVLTKHDVDLLLLSLGLEPEDFSDDLISVPFVEAP